MQRLLNVKLSCGSNALRLSPLVLILCLNFLVPALLWCQTSTSAVVQGNVHDTDGSGIPRAHVELLHVPTGTTYRIAADEEGHYLFAGIRIGGPYTLSVSHIGYGTQERKGIILRAYQNTRVDVVLQQVSLPGEEVLVTGTGGGILVNQSASPSLRVERNQLDMFPQASGSLEDAQRLSPYMVGQSALGSSRVYSDVSLDGVGISDQFGLQRVETVPMGMQASPVTMESIQEVNVDIAPYDVQRSGFTGAAISALTRQGSNTVTGSLYGHAAGGWLLGHNPDNGRSDLHGFADNRAGFRIGGPIVASKAFHFLAVEFSRVRVPIERQFGAKASKGTVFSFSPAVISQFQTVLDTAYGYDPGRMDIVTLERQSANVFARFDLELSPGQRFSLRYNLAASETDRPPYETSVFADGTLARNTNTVQSVVASLNTIITPSLANELLIAYTRRELTTTLPATPFPFVDVTVSDEHGWWNHLTAGSEVGGYGNYAYEDHLEFRNSTSLSLGSHLLTGGVQGDIHGFRSQLLPDQWGRYTFASLSALQQGRPSEYEYRYARASGTDLESRWRALQFGAFLQDELTLSSVFSITAGVRVDLPFFPDHPEENNAARETFLRFGHDISTARVPGARAMLSPRVGFTIKPRGDDSAQVRAGLGVFTGRVPYAWIDNLYSRTGLDYVHLKRTASLEFVADPWSQPKSGPQRRWGQTAEIVAMSPDFVLPQELRGSFAIDLAFRGNILISLEAVLSRTLHGVVFRNINLYPVDTMKYYNWSVLPFPRNEVERVLFGTRDARYTNVMVMSNVTEGATDFYTLQIQRRPDGDGLFASAAYTWGTTKDINSGGWDNAYDQWRYNPALNPNEPLPGYSSFDRRHRIAAAFSYQHEWSPGFSTTVGIVYTGLSGTPYSYVYDGDVNGDGESLNDLLFIPAAEKEVLLLRYVAGEYQFIEFGGPEYKQFFKFIEDDEYLSANRGRIASRNGARSPWVHQLDMRISQCIPMEGSQQFEITAELLNVLNLLNPSWGLVQTVPNQIVPLLRKAGSDPRMFIFAPRETPFTTEPLLSRWRLRLGVRYSF